MVVEESHNTHLCSNELTVKDRAGLSDAVEIGRLTMIGFHA